MLNTDVVILAGGFGTRLQTVVSDVPKPMAPVCGKPFLEFIFLHLKKLGVKRVILSVGYKAEVIENYFGNSFQDIKVDYAHENEPLGTGGGILNTKPHWQNKHQVILNGDTFFSVDLNLALSIHQNKKADVSLCLKRMDNTSRYGTVELNESGRILKFEEKKAIPAAGVINAGIYIFNQEKINAFDFPQRFSIEKDFFEKQLQDLNIYGIVTDDYFIDIGIPEDYKKANEDFARFIH